METSESNHTNTPFATVPLLEKIKADLDREKFELNTSRLALEQASTLKEIGHDSTLDDEDKIRRAREMVFGTAAPK